LDSGSGPASIPNKIVFICNGGALVVKAEDGSIWVIALHVSGAMAPSYCLREPSMTETEEKQEEITTPASVVDIITSCRVAEVTRHMSSEEREELLGNNDKSDVDDEESLCDVWGLLFSDGSISIYESDLRKYTYFGDNSAKYKLSLQNCTTELLHVNLVVDIDLDPAVVQAAISSGVEPPQPFQAASLCGAHMGVRSQRNGSRIMCIIAISTPEASTTTTTASSTSTLHTHYGESTNDPNCYLMETQFSLPNTKSATDDTTSIDRNNKHTNTNHVVGEGDIEGSKGKGETGLGAAYDTLEEQSVTSLLSIPIVNAPEEDQPGNNNNTKNGPEGLSVGAAAAGVDGGSADHIEVGGTITAPLVRRLRLGIINHFDFSCGLLATTSKAGVRVYDVGSLGEKPEKDPKHSGYLQRRLCCGAFSGFARSAHMARYPAPLPLAPIVEVRGSTHDNTSRDPVLSLHAPDGGVVPPSLVEWDGASSIAIMPNSEHSSDVFIYVHRAKPLGLLMCSVHFNAHSRYVNPDSDSDSDSDSSDDSRGAKKFLRNNMSRLYR
jgi:hypothetical protein